jgi:hypothetical protein
MVDKVAGMALILISTWWHDVGVTGRAKYCLNSYHEL